MESRVSQQHSPQLARENFPERFNQYLTELARDRFRSVMDMVEKLIKYPVRDAEGQWVAPSSSSLATAGSAKVALGGVVGALAERTNRADAVLPDQSPREGDEQRLTSQRNVRKLGIV